MSRPSLVYMKALIPLSLHIDKQRPKKPFIISIRAVLSIVRPRKRPSEPGTGATTACAGDFPHERDEPFASPFGEAKARAINRIPKIIPVAGMNRLDRTMRYCFIALLGWGVLRAGLRAGRWYYDACSHRRVRIFPYRG